MSTIGTSKKRLWGLRRFPLSAPSTREDATQFASVEALPDFQAAIVQDGRILPGRVQREFEDHLKCGGLNTDLFILIC
jgi:hypothetical protein